MLKGSSSCTASSSMPNMKMAAMVAAGTAPMWFHVSSKASHSASGISSSHTDRKRAVCRVYTSGTGLAKIRSQTSVASPSFTRLLSASARRFSSMGRPSSARERAPSARSGRCRAASSSSASAAGSRARRSVDIAASSSGPPRCASSVREKAHPASRTRRMCSPRCGAPTSASIHMAACRWVLRRCATMRPQVARASTQRA
mmetsp:Transcript_27762/g.71445  ORF Transcript_27762/g.71445 Transcript_27762/m.71445 type:complete len:201 (-) Transcript_27762:539-1141(-)